MIPAAVIDASDVRSAQDSIAAAVVKHHTAVIVSVVWIVEPSQPVTVIFAAAVVPVANPIRG